VAHRRLLGAGLIAVVGLSAVSCGATTDGAARPPTITPGPAHVELGATEQFSVSGDASVIWGVAEEDAAAPPPAYPVRVEADGRYLVDDQDRPWRIQADAGWLMSAEATPQEVDEYLATRQAQGFNSFYLHAMVHPGGYDAAPNAPNNLQGDPPFASAGDFSTAGASPASERYWAWIDSIIDKAAAHGMVVMLAYTYLGYQGGDQGWYQEVLAQPGRQALFEWGRWLGDRYRDRPNVIWFGLGDYTPPEGSEGARRVRAIAEGIKAAGATQLFMAEASGPDEIPGTNADFGSIVDVNSFYGYGPDGQGAVYETADRAWRLSPAKPAWMEEGTYEGENNSGAFSGESWETRRGRFWSVLAGGTAGDGFGSRDAWQWSDFPASLASPGADDSSHAFELFGSLPWWELQPSGTDPGFAGTTLIASGQGTWGQPDFVTSALTTGHDWLLAYVPVTQTGARTFAVDLSAMAGPARARWFDPDTGTYLAVDDGDVYDNAGPQSFTTPGSRSDGTDDWLLVIDTTGLAPCGTITADGRYTAPTTIPDGLSCQVTASLRTDPSILARATLDVG